MLQSCFIRRPRVKRVNIQKVDDRRGYLDIKAPYYRKKPNFWSYMFAIGSIGGGGYAMYSNASTPDQQVTNAAIGAVGGLVASELWLLIIGNHKKIYLADSSKVTKWVADYNNYHSKEWILLNRPNYTKDSLRVLPKDKELSFLPSNITDVKNYSDIWDNQYLNTVIDTATPLVSKPELEELIQKFPLKSSILNTKAEFINRSTDENECMMGIKRFPEAQSKVEFKYASLIKSFQYSRDFIHRYPKTTYSDLIFGKVYPTTSKKFLEELIDLYPSVNNDLAQKSRTIFYDDIDSLDLLLNKLNKYKDTFYFIKPTDNYENFAEADSLHSVLVQNEGRNDRRINKLMDQLRNDYLSLAINSSKGSEEESNTLYKRVMTNGWLKKEGNDSLYEQCVMEYCKNNNESHFTGKTNSQGQAIGEGVLYTTKGERWEGNFVKGKLNGKGKYRKDDKNKYGNFIEGELYGEGTVKDSTKIITGYFVNGNLSGKGKIIYSDNRWESGDYFLFKLNGNGEKHYMNGNSFNGGFKKGEFSGKGVYNWKAEGISFEGNFVNYKRDSSGVLHLSNTLVAIGKWKEDCPVDTIVVKETTWSTEILATYIYKDCKIVSEVINSEKGKIDKNLLLVHIPEAEFRYYY